jgi:NAD(P)H dehydrogenase (quinone)
VSLDPSAEPPVLPTATYAVTGATGHLGRLAVDALLRRGVPARNVFALARDTARLDDVAALGVGVREADYDRPDTLRAALDGIERLLFVSGSEVGRRLEQHTAVVDAANAADVGFIVYTSVIRADDTQLVLAPEHAATEQVLESSGLPFASARNSFYLEVHTARVEEYLAAGEIVGAAGEGRISGATRADFAEAAVALLAGDIVESTGYHELGGPSYSLADVAATITEVTGSTVTYRDLSAEDLTAELVRAGVDGETAGFVASIDSSIARGELETSSDELTRLLGRGPTGLLDAVRAARA